jgi:cytoskeletal protein CcmA (bactofilin family)
MLANAKRLLGVLSMFSRSNDTPPPVNPASAVPPPTPQQAAQPASQNGAAPPVNPLPRSAAAHRTQMDSQRTTTRDDGVSVIGRDLTIIGEGLRIVSHGQIQIDGEVRGDVFGDEIVIGEQGRVNGTVGAARVVVNGTVAGTIRGQEVLLASSARVEADLYHATLSLEQGALFEGRSRRAKEGENLKPDIDSLSKGGAVPETGTQARPAPIPATSNT